MNNACYSVEQSLQFPLDFREIAGIGARQHCKHIGSARSAASSILRATSHVSVSDFRRASSIATKAT